MTQLKYQQIFNEIRGQIVTGKLTAGDTIPTHQQMMERYSAALGTVRQAVLQLQHEGLVRGERGKGMFVAERASGGADGNDGARTIGFLTFNAKGSDPSLASIMALQADLSEHRLDLSVRVLGPEDHAQAVPWITDALGYVVWAGCDSAVLERLAESGRPVVFIGVTRDGRVPPQVHHVTWDFEEAVTLVAETVFGMWHTRVRLVRRTGSAYCESMSRLFFAAADRAGVRATCDEWIAPGEGWERDLASELERLADSPDRPTAIICENAAGACQLIHRVQNMGWPVPQRLSIAAISSAYDLAATAPSLTHVRTPFDVALRKAVQILRTETGGGRICHVEVPLRLHLGETCGPP